MNQLVQQGAPGSVRARWCDTPAAGAASAEAPDPMVALLKGLDNVSHGIALFDVHCTMLYANVAGRSLLARACLAGAVQRPVRGIAHAETWRQIVERVCTRAHRELVRVPGSSHSVFAALVPVGTPEQPLAFVTFAREELCGAIELQMLASHYGLTSAESHVLGKLCRGLNAGQIAREHGVAPTTVLTQIAAIRSKTAASTIRKLLDTLARMPPLTPLSSLIAMH